ELKIPEFERSLGSNEQWSNVGIVATMERDTVLAWVAIAAAVFLLLLITTLRTDLGRRGRVHEQPRDDTEDMASRALVDPKGRRYITDRDTEDFVHKTWTQLPWRLGLSIAAGAIFAGVIGFSHLVLEPFDTSLPFWLALALPIGIVTWILVSWGVWTRLHLLRYGHAVEGQWFDSGTSNQSLCYTLGDGRTYRMKKGQWTRADHLPVVLFDPSRPRLASQYTGNGQFPVAPRKDAGRLSGTSVTRDILRLLLGVILVAATGWLGYTAFVSAFPEPISSWQMSRIEAAGSDDVMLGPCLEFCSENGDAACVSQCHRRQMGYVLGKAGIELEGDPKLLPSQFRHQQLEQVNRVVAT